VQKCLGRPRRQGLSGNIGPRPVQKCLGRPRRQGLRPCSCGSYWRFTEAEFAASAAHFGNPDFMEVVLHSCRHRFALVPGDPAHEDLQMALARLPPITVPAMDLQGEARGVTPPPSRPSSRFTGPFERRILPCIGHNPPQEAPQNFANALLDLAAWSA